MGVVLAYTEPTAGKALKSLSGKITSNTNLTLSPKFDGCAGVPGDKASHYLRTEAEVLVGWLLFSWGVKPLERQFERISTLSLLHCHNNFVAIKQSHNNVFPENNYKKHTEHCTFTSVVARCHLCLNPMQSSAC